ncbi:NodB domain [Trinorchestia longiramus]|nr:NodB domain [Trinorchestia longiramus]
MNFLRFWESGAPLLLLLFATNSALGELAVDCVADLCALPNCSCSSTATPGGLSPDEIPHFVVLSFDDGVTVTNHPFYQELQAHKNPNNCGIEMTFFVSHENSDYTLINDLYRNGHEIAVHSVTHKSDVQFYWRNLTKEGWMAEIEQQKQMLEIYGEIPGSEITDETVGTKPTDAFPGLWVAPMTDLQDNRGIECSMLDACQSAEDELETSSAAVTDLLKRNFRSHYNARTPFGVYTHHSWFYNETRKQGLRDFLEYLTAFPEVYVVSVRQMMEWVRNPVPLADLGDLDSFKCKNTLPNLACAESDNINCHYTEPLPISNAEIYMKICQGPCPKYYPYLNNVDGSKSYPLDGLEMQLKEVAATALVLLLATVAFTTIGQAEGDAPECTATDAQTCNNANCRCSSTDVPGGLNVWEVPQFVLLTFDDTITESMFPEYEALSTLTNPNGCPISMTFFACHEGMDYTLVNRLYRMGHEIASHSVSHNPDVANYWDTISKDQWATEISDMRTMLNLYGKIPTEDIVGFRVPYLEVGGNPMYQALLESGFTYDCSWPTYKYTPWYTDWNGQSYGTLWPYTLDYLSIQEQTAGTRPTDSFPGLWLAPMTSLQDNTGGACPMLDYCLGVGNELDTSGDAVADLLIRNFQSHYYSDRAPFGVYTHPWYFQADTDNGVTAHHDGIRMFMEYLADLPDVYVVSVHQLIQWVQNPVSLANIGSFAPLQCSNTPPDNCPVENQASCYYTAPLPNNNAQAYMKICEGPCPSGYPWTGNPTGQV